MRPAPRASMRLCVVGKTGTGKSYAVKERLREWLARGVRVVAVDVCDEYSKDGKPRNGLTNEGPLRKRVRADELARNPQLLADARLSLAVVPTDTRSPTAMARTFLLVNELVRALERPCVIVCDEVGQWTRSDAGKDCHRARVALEALATAGRKDGFALVCVSQAAAHIPPNVRRQSDEWLAFLQDDPADVEAMAERMGKETAEEVSRLPQFRSIEWRDATHHQKSTTTTAALRAV